jgi:hypothetical protein
VQLVCVVVQICSVWVEVEVLAWVAGVLSVVWPV